MRIGRRIEQLVGHHVVDEINNAARNTTNAYLVNFFFDPTLGHYMLSQTKAGRNYIGGEIIVTTIVASVVSWECDGCLGLAWYDFAIAAVDEMAAANSAKRQHKDVLNSVAVAGATSLASSYIANFVIPSDLGPEFEVSDNLQGIFGEDWYPLAKASNALTSNTVNYLLNNSIHLNDTWPMTNSSSGNGASALRMQSMIGAGTRTVKTQSNGLDAYNDLEMSSELGNDLNSEKQKRMARSLRVTQNN